MEKFKTLADVYKDKQDELNKIILDALFAAAKDVGIECVIKAFTNKSVL